MVSAYYALQENRKRFANQVSQLEKQEKPMDVIHWMLSQAEGLEKNIARALDIYSGAQPIGARMRKVVGIGPVISAGLIAHIEMDIATHPGKLEAFAGLDPTREWKKGEKRPHNADLKVLCWKIGQSFLKLHKNEKCFYGHLYAARKKQEEERNARGEFEQQAKQKLEKFKIGKSTEAYKHYSAGRLPPAHLNARALRFATKIFLSHLHANWLEELGRTPVMPWVIAHGGHVDYIKPNW